MLARAISRHGAAPSILTVSCAGLLLVIFALPPGGDRAADPPAAAAKAIPRPDLFFVANEGQRAEPVLFRAGGLDLEADFGATGIDFLRSERVDAAASAGRIGPRGRGLRLDAETGRPVLAAEFETERVRLEFVGARAGVRPVGRDRLRTSLNLFKGPRSQWKTGIATYGRIVYPNLWEGIDLEYLGADGALKYNFIVYPGADPAQIQLAWRDAAGVRITPEGGLEVSTGRGRIEDGRPLAFQAGRDGQATVAADFVIAQEASSSGSDSWVLGFDVGDYDPGQTLVIDPAYPVYAGFFGTSSYDRGLGVAVDAAGHAYITGETTDPSSQDTDAYVAKIALDGSGYDYISLIGGDGYDGSFDIVVDAAGNSYITGPTMSDEGSFPLTMGPDLGFNGLIDILVAKLAPDGQDLVYAGYLGGQMTEFGEGIRVDAEGAVYLHGIALSNEASFPVKGGPDLSFNGETDAFVAKIRPVPDAEAVEDNLVYAGYIGGNGSDITLVQDDTWSILSSGHIAIDAAGALYLSGQTTSMEDSFPDGDGFGDLPGADQTWAGLWDAYVAKVEPGGRGLAYASYVGGAGEDTGKGMAVDAEGHAYLTGYTDSTEDSLPVTGGPDLSFNGQLDAFVAKMSADGSAFDFLGYFGGDDLDGAESIILDGQGRVVIVGYTESQAGGFPAKNGPDASQNDATDGAGDAYVARLVADPTAPELLDNVDFAGYVGGGAYDQAFWVGLDGQDGIYLVGDTESGADSFPDGDGLADLPGPMRALPGGGDGFVVKVALGEALPTGEPEPTATPQSMWAVYIPVVLGDAMLGASAERARDSLASVLAPGQQGIQVRRALAHPAGLDGPAQEREVERFYDDFCDFVAGWTWEKDAQIDIRLDVDLGRCHYVMGRLTDGAYGSSSNGISTPEDFYLETLAEYEGSGGAAGLLFGATDALDAGYIYVVFDSGLYGLVQFGAGSGTLHRGETELDFSEPVSLALRAEGERITLYANGTMLAQVEDAGPHAGRVGSYVESDGSEPFYAHYDYIRFAEILAP